MATAVRIESGAGHERLYAALDRLEREAARLPLASLAERVDGFRRDARAFGMGAAASIATAFGEAIARSGRGAMIPAYFEGLRESLGCDPTDMVAADAILASVGVRLAG